MRRHNLAIAKHVRTAFDDDGSAVIVGMNRINLHLVQYVFLTRVAGRVWRHMLEQKCVLREAISAVARVYGITPERLAADLQPVVQKLLRHRLLKKVK
jgi:hypothetical protein